MFDHLDSPRPFTPDAGFRARVVAAGRSRQRRRRLTVTGIVVVLAVAGLAASAVALVNHKVDQVQRIDVGSLPPPPSSDQPQVYLFVGIDKTSSDPSMSDGASDSVILARTDPGTHTVDVLPLPRDLWVDLAGHGPNRLNVALSLGGPDLLIATIKSEFGISVDHYIEADFDGVVAIANAVGGIRLAFDTPVMDRQTGFDLRYPGCTTLDGQGLLALARSRHMAAVVGGRLVYDTYSDDARIERQQVIASALIRRLVDVDARDPRQLVRLVDAAVDNVTIDRGLTPRRLVDLFRAVAGSKVRQHRIPVLVATHDGNEVLDLAPSSGAALRAFRSGAEPSGNGSLPGVPGQPKRLVLPEPC